MTSAGMAVFDLDGTLLVHGALTGEAIRMLRTLPGWWTILSAPTGRW